MMYKFIMSDKYEYASVYYDKTYIGRVQPAHCWPGYSFVQVLEDKPVHELEKGFWLEFDSWMKSQ